MSSEHIPRDGSRLVLIAVALLWTGPHVSAQRGSRLEVQTGHSLGISRIALSEHGDKLGSYGVDGSVVLWDVRSGHQVWDTLIAPGAECFGFSTDGSRILASYGAGNVVRAMWSGSGVKGEEVPVCAEPEVRVGGSLFRIQESWKLFGSFTRLMRNRKGKWREVLAPEYKFEEFTVLKVHRRSSQLILGRRDGVVIGVDTNGTVGWLLKAHNQEVTDLAIDEQDDFVYASSLDGSISCIDLRSREIVDRFFERVERFTCSSLTGSRLQLGTLSGNVYEVDLQHPFAGVSRQKISHQPIASITALNDSVRLCYERGTRAFSVEYDRVKRIERIASWDPKSYMPWQNRPQQWAGSAITGALFSPDGRSHVRSIRRGVAMRYEWADGRGHRKRIATGEGSIHRFIFMGDTVVFGFGIRMRRKQYKRVLKGAGNEGVEQDCTQSYWKDLELNGPGIRIMALPVAAQYAFKLDEREVLVINAGVWRTYDVPSGSCRHAFTTSTRSVYALGEGLFAYEDDSLAIHLVHYDGVGFSEAALFRGLQGHVVSVHRWKERDQIVNVYSEGILEVWNAASGENLYSLIPVGRKGIVAITDSGYFAASGRVSSGLSFVDQGEVIGLDQMDVLFNRPDLIMERGGAERDLVKAYSLAYHKRLAHLGLSDRSVDRDIPRPECSLINSDQVRGVVQSATMCLKVEMRGNGAPLKDWNVFVNDVPLFGSNGRALPEGGPDQWIDSVKVTLSEGRNKIEVTSRNNEGVSSLSRPIHVRYDAAERSTGEVIFLGIALDHHQFPGHDLHYAVKDIRDLATALALRFGDTLAVDTLFDGRVTLENVRALKRRLLMTSVNDKVIVAYSGHGLLSKEFDYYLAAFGVDFSDPAVGGLPYEELEALLDSIPARRKLLLIDACNSGEVDREEVLASETSLPDGTRGQPLELSYTPVLGLKGSFELMQELFANVNRGTGATVISASGGTQYAYEGQGGTNGVFTSSILELLGREGHVTVSELKEYVGRRVMELTNGNQRPTSRNETLEFDWDVW